MEFKRLFVLFAVFLAVSGMAMAIRGAVVDSATDLTRWDGTGGGEDITEGGNITEADLNGTSLTDRWAGYYGNITTAVIYLIDNDTATANMSNYLYHWVLAGANKTGEVCVSTAPAYNFATATGLSTNTDINTAWGFAGGADLADATFDDATCVNFVFEEQGVTIAGAVRADHQGSSNFETCAINNSAVAAGDINELAYCVVINATGGTSYKNTAVEYELIVPANDTVAATTTYYFYMELGA